MFTKLMAGIVGLMSVSGAASATLLGKSIDATLSGGSFFQLVTQFSSPALIADPGVEFLGVLQAGVVCPSSSCLVGIEIDFDDTGFIIRNKTLSGFSSHNGSGFNIRFFNLPSNIISVVEFAGIGFEASLSGNVASGFFELTYSGWNSGSVDRYGFTFSPPPPPPPPIAMPEPAALILFGFGLVGLGCLRHRRFISRIAGQRRSVIANRRA